MTNRIRFDRQTVVHALKNDFNKIHNLHQLHERNTMTKLDYSVRSFANFTI